MGFQPPDRLRERLGRLLREEKPGPRTPFSRREHRFGRPALAENNDRRAAGLGLQRHDAEILVSRKQQRPGPPQMFPNRLLREPAGQSDFRAGQSGQSPPVRPGPNHDQATAEPVARLDHQLDPLVRHQGRDADVVILARDLGGSVKPGVDRRADDPACAAVALGDPSGNRAARGHEMRDPIA